MTYSIGLTLFAIINECLNYTLKHIMFMQQSTRQMLYNNTTFTTLGSRSQKTDNLGQLTFVEIYYAVRVQQKSQQQNTGYTQ